MFYILGDDDDEMSRVFGLSFSLVSEIQIGKRERWLDLDKYKQPEWYPHVLCIMYYGIWAPNHPSFLEETIESDLNI